MSITVSLWSKKHGEIKRFLERFYQKETGIDEDVEKWIYVYNNPLKSTEIISAVLDNSDIFDIHLFIQINDGQLHYVTIENYNDIIKSIFQLYYVESDPVYC